MRASLTPAIVMVGEVAATTSRNKLSFLSSLAKLVSLILLVFPFASCAEKESAVNIFVQSVVSVVTLIFLKVAVFPSASQLTKSSGVATGRPN